MTKKRLGIFFLLPVFLVLGSLTIYPTIVCVQLSLTLYELGKPLTDRIYVGLENFKFIFSSYAFWKAVRITLVYTGTCVGLEIFLGIAIGLLLGRKFRGQNVVMSLIFLPMIMTPVAVGLTWKSMFNYIYGILNYYLNYLGLSPPWLVKPFWALISLIIVDVWQWTPFVFIMTVSGLYSLPVEPFEAAVIDGASRWQILRFITLPLLKPLLIVALLIRTCDSFKIFDNIYILTSGGPGTATEVLSLSIYKTNFFSEQVGRAAAMSLIMLIIAIILSQIIIRMLRKEGILIR